MITLPDHGYVTRTITLLDAGGVAQGSLGGGADVIDRPGLRYSVSYEVNPLRSSDEARIFEGLLEQGLRDDVSYPWPLDRRSAPAGVPLVDGASAVGGVIPLKGLPNGFVFRVGQAFAVAHAGIGYIHKARATVAVDALGKVTLPVFPQTRVALANNDVVEIVRPRIRGFLTWNGSNQGPAGSRPFSFSITERR